MARSDASVAARPAAAPAAVRLALVAAVLVTVLGALLVLDALVAAGLVTASAWTPRALAGLDGLTPGSWALPAGLLAAVLGLWGLVLALMPRRHREIAVGSTGQVWLRPRDAARLVRAQVTDLPGVLEARTAAGRRRMIVDLTTTRSDGAALSTEAVAAARAVLAPLRPEPRVQVRVRTKGLA
jgi:hypothetical protein